MLKGGKERKAVKGIKSKDVKGKWGIRSKGDRKTKGTGCRR